jgi:endonuclease/exonuclease/phosphatase family metal-dependent hydrolase
MAGKPRIWARRLLLWLNVASVLVYGLSCLAAYISPVSARYFSLLGLAFPFLMAHIFLLIFFDLVLKPKFALIPAIALLLSFRQVSVAFGLHKPVAFQMVRMHGTVRIAHWNVARFMEWRRNNNEGSQTRQRMLEQIKNQNADVLCFQEFYHSTDSLYYDNLNYISKRFHYPYVYFSWDSDGWKQWFGQVIFSRLPIVDTGRVRFPRPGMPETLLYADVVTGRDTVRIFTTHLQSYKLDKVDYERIEKIKNREDSILDNSKNVVQKLTRASQYRAAQADLVNKAVAQSPTRPSSPPTSTTFPTPTPTTASAASYRMPSSKKAWALAAPITGFLPRCASIISLPQSNGRSFSSSASTALFRIIICWWRICGSGISLRFIV